jgi:hypothetical protein
MALRATFPTYTPEEYLEFERAAMMRDQLRSLERTVERQQVAACLRWIDEARLALEGQRNPDNRETARRVRELRQAGPRRCRRASHLDGGRS